MQLSIANAYYFVDYRLILLIIWLASRTGSCQSSQQPVVPSTGSPAPAQDQQGQQKDITCSSQLESPESLTGFPVFPEGTKSSVARFNTCEIWDQFHDKKDSHGVSYKLCIFSGCKNVNSGIGVYAGSHDSYKTFAPLMDKVIEDYHGHKPEDSHVSDMDASKLTCPPLPQDEADMIISTRIRVGRNLEGYPLGPGVSKEQRDDIMQKVVDACNTFTGDLKGTFYPLEGMDKAATQDQLIAVHTSCYHSNINDIHTVCLVYTLLSLDLWKHAHAITMCSATKTLLFTYREGDRFLEACGCITETGPLVGLCYYQGGSIGGQGGIAPPTLGYK